MTGPHPASSASPVPVDGWPPVRKGKGLLREIVSFPRSLFDNPVFNRQVLVTLGGTKFAIVFLLINITLIITTISTIFGSMGRSFPGGGAGLGSVLATITNCAVYGLLGFFLPLQVVRLFETQRHDHVFDQVVVTGVPPWRLHLGNWAATMAYAAVILAATLPYQAFAHACKGVTVLEIARDYGLLLLYSNVIVLVTMAFGVAMNEILAVLLGISFFGFLGFLSSIPEMPSALTFWTPLRAFLQEGGDSLFSYYFYRTIHQPPVIFNIEIPEAAMYGAIWGFMALGALVYITLGPAHLFSPGLNNFGSVVMPGDRKRSRLRTLRLNLNRRVEMAFLYENRSRFWDAWDWTLRSFMILATAGIWWILTIGFFFAPGFTRNSPSFWEGFQVYILVMGGIGVAFGLYAYGESRDRIYHRERVGPFRLPRELLALLFFAALLAGFVFFAYYPLETILRREIASLASANPPPRADWIPRLQTLLDLLIERIVMVTIFACNLFLLGRLSGRISKTVWGNRSNLVLVTLLLLFAPLILLPLYWERIISSPDVARLSYISPIMALWESFDPNDRTFNPSRLGSGMYLYFIIQLSLAGLLLLSIVLLNIRHHWKERRKASNLPTEGNSPIAGASSAGVVLLLVLGFGGYLAGDDLGVEVVRGFQGKSYSNADPFTVVFSRDAPSGAAGPKAETAVYWLETTDGDLYLPPRRVEIPPGTRTVIRFAVEPSREYHGPLQEVKLLVRLGEIRREVEVPPVMVLGNETMRFLLVSDEGRIPSLIPSHQSWIGSRPLWLPERPEAYVGCDIVLVGPTDFNSWSLLQRRALYDFVRSGGTVVFFGSIDPRSLQAAPEWEELLVPAGAPRTETSGISFRLHPLRNGRVTWTVEDGERTLPVLELKGLGPGRVGYLSVDPRDSATAERFGGPEKFFQQLGEEIPFSLGEAIPLIYTGFGWMRGGGTSILAVGVYFAAYAILLGPAMFFLFRARRRQLFIWAYAPVLSLTFILGAPLIFSTMSEPSAAREASFTFWGIGDDIGVRHTVLHIHSSGRQDHRISFQGKDVNVFSATHGSRSWQRMGRRSWQRPGRLGGSLEPGWILTPLGSKWGEGPLEVPDLSVSPWGRRMICVISRDPRAVPAPVEGRVTATLPASKDEKEAGRRRTNRASDRDTWSWELEGLPPGARASIAIFLPSEWPQSELNKVKMGAPSTQKLMAVQDGRNELLYLDASPSTRTFQLPAQFSSNRLLRPRVFVILEEPVPPPVAISRDLNFENPYEYYRREQESRLAYTLRELEVVISEKDR